jgi:hypothetical protein
LPSAFRSKNKPDTIEEMVRQGLYYSTLNKMPDLLDKECRRPSRCYLVKLLINFGANPNHISKEALLTPVHWLAFWGDHRAIRITVMLNRSDLIRPPGCCPETREIYIQKRGALNAFISKRNQTPADIAGDLKNYKCLQYIVEHFFFNMEDRIRNVFITPELVNKFENKRFAQKRTKSIKFTAERTQPEYIKLTTLSSKEFSNEQKAFMHLAYWAISLSNIDDMKEESDKKQESKIEFELDNDRISEFLGDGGKEKLEKMKNQDEDGKYEIMMKQFV